MAIEKRKVTMTNAVAAPGGVQTHVATDHVPLDILDAYVADAKLRWQSVQVGDEHDPGPGGDDGETHYPPHLTGT
jgi:hypothetical protein